MARKKNNITLSPKYGVNPSLLKCPICGKDMGVALMGKLKDDVEAPKEIKDGLCDDCKKKYVTLIEVESESNPIRTGKRMFLLKECLKEELRNHEYLLVTSEMAKEIEEQMNGSDKQNTQQS